MNKKILALSIIGFCFISLLVGIFSNVNAPKENDMCVASESKGIFKGFPGSTNKIALISLDGVIQKSEKESIFSSMTTAENVLKALKKAQKDKSVKGVLFRVNSPGGTVGMSQEIYSTMLRVRESKPVVVSMADVAASGGYYIASAADRIYANPGTITGSIGVIMGTINAQELLSQKLGVKQENIKSGEFKDTGSIYRPLSERDRELLQGLVNNAYGQFVGAIKNSRIGRNDDYNIEKQQLTEANLKKYADGRIFTGEQALKYGFVDKLGGLYTAEKDIIKMVQQKNSFIEDDIPVVNYNKATGFSDFFINISESISKHGFQINSYLPMSVKYARQPLFVWE